MKIYDVVGRESGEFPATKEDEISFLIYMENINTFKDLR